jgi:hypothetical protein
MSQFLKALIICVVFCSVSAFAQLDNIEETKQFSKDLVSSFSMYIYLFLTMVFVFSLFTAILSKYRNEGLVGMVCSLIAVFLYAKSPDIFWKIVTPFIPK